jgi:hypothetical protein
MEDLPHDTSLLPASSPSSPPAASSSASTTTTTEKLRLNADARSTQFLSLLSQTSAAHVRQQGLASALQDADTLSRGVRRYLDSGLGAALAASCDALREFNVCPGTHITRLQHHARMTGTVEGVRVPLAYQLGFREMMARLTTLTGLLTGSEANTVSWAQNTCLATQDIEVVAACLRNCLALLDQYSKLNVAPGK